MAKFGYSIASGTTGTKVYLLRMERSRKIRGFGIRALGHRLNIWHI